MAKLGRKKKELLEAVDLERWQTFQKWLSARSKELAGQLTPEMQKYVTEFLVNDADSQFTITVKALKFKHLILHKPLTQDECTYFIALDDVGTAPSQDRRLTKMAICKIEDRALKKLRAALGKKFNIFELRDVYDTGRHRVAVEEMTFDSKPNEGYSDGERSYYST